MDLRANYAVEPKSVYDILEEEELPDTTEIENLKYDEGSYVFFSQEEPKKQWIQSQLVLELDEFR
jgi:hypothetical protein